MISRCDILLYVMFSNSSACETSPTSSITRTFHCSGGPSGSPFALLSSVRASTGSVSGSFKVQDAADPPASCVCQFGVDTEHTGVGASWAKMACLLPPTVWSVMKV